MLFLSHADEDAELAARIAGLLAGDGEEVCRWTAPGSGKHPPAGQVEEQIGRAEAFIALLTDAYPGSPRCRRERQLAWCRSEDLRLAGIPGTFFGVLRSGAAAGPESSFPGERDWVDLGGPESYHGAIRALLAKLRAGKPQGSASPEMTGPGPIAPLFRNRVEELDLVRRALNNVGGDHFWLVIAPPQLGKTWFLDRLGAELSAGEEAGERTSWAIRLVDLREQSVEARASPAALLRLFFGPAVPDDPGPGDFGRIATRVVAGRVPLLCVLDNAELLARQVAAALRDAMAVIHLQVRRGPRPNVRLAFVVADRHDDAWRSVVPAPRLTILPLTEFKVDVVERAVRDLALEMDTSVDKADLQHIAELAHGLSEGLPALLVRCLSWIKAEEWIGWDRLASQELFLAFAESYIRDVLMSRDSLFPLSAGQYGPPGWGRSDDPRQALEHCFRLLAPYRRITMSHIWHHIAEDGAPDPDLTAAIARMNWSVESLWQAINGAALLSRPLDEVWQEIQPAIRRVLFRYYYRTDEVRAKAHRNARKFVEVWAAKQSGKEQVIGMIESLWHEAADLRFSGSADLEATLSNSARALAGALKKSDAYTVRELRDYAEGRMAGDEEFRRTVGDDGLFNRLITIVRGSHQG